MPNIRHASWKVQGVSVFANFLEIIRVPKPIFSHNSDLLNKKKKPEIYFCEFPSAGLGDLKKKKKTDLFQALIACNR